GKTCIQAVGTGARVRLQNSVLLAGGAAVHLDPGPAPKGHFNSQCLLENVTVAARKAVVQLGDAPKLAFAVDPFIFESRTSLFLDPFTGTGPSGGMVQYDGIALARGLLVWQGEGNGFDKRLAFAAAATGSSPEPQPLATVWPRLWGPLGERPPSSYNLVGRTLDLDKPQLDQLTASVPGRP